MMRNAGVYTSNKISSMAPDRFLKSAEVECKLRSRSCLYCGYGYHDRRDSPGKDNMPQTWWEGAFFTRLSG